MDDGATDAADHAVAALSSDELFHVLSDADRRTVLFHLRQHRVATVAELVEVLTAVRAADASEVDPASVQASLHHSQLPSLENSGLVTYDRDRGTVESTRLDGELGEWLDLAVRRQLRVEEALDADDRSDRETIRVLLVDDEPGLADTVGAYVERENDDVTVTTATSVLEAVTTLGEDAEAFDCIVSDYQMPAISGLDFLQVVREEDSELPFIVFTAKGSERVASRAIATGVTDYVQKGPDVERFDELVERIRDAVDRE